MQLNHHPLAKGAAFVAGFLWDTFCTVFPFFGFVVAGALAIGAIAWMAWQ